MLCVQKSVLFLAVAGVAGSLASCRSRSFSEAKNDTPAAATTGPVTPTDGAGLWKATEEKIFQPRIHRIQITMNGASLDSLQGDEFMHGCKSRSDEKWAHVRSFEFDGVRLENAAVKIRGNTSRCIPRVQLSVKFNKTKDVVKKNERTEQWQELKYPDDVKDRIETQSLFGLGSISLRRSRNDSNSPGDPSTHSNPDPVKQIHADGGEGILGREYVSSWAFAETEKLAPTTFRGAPVYRVAYALVEFRLCQNDADKSCDRRFSRIYNVAENIDEDFIKTRFDDKDATLVQLDKGCAFNPKNVKPFLDCFSPSYIKGKKFDESDASQVARVTEMMEGPTGLKTLLDAATTEDDVAKVVEIDSFLNYMVSAATVGHWDSAYGNFNNDVLYFNSKKRVWSILAWDLDNTQQGRFESKTADYSDVQKEKRVLFDPFFRIPTLKAKFDARVKGLCSALYTKRDAGPVFDFIENGAVASIKKIMATKCGSDNCVGHFEKIDLGPEDTMKTYFRRRYDALCK